jgi:hypothetical protein
LVALIAAGVVAAADEPRTATEIVVWGKAVDEAREAVVESILDHGYTLVRKRDDGSAVYRHEDSPWKGRVILDDDGWMLIRREPIRVEGRPVLPGMARNSPAAWAMCAVWPFLCVRAGGATISGAKMRGATHELVDELSPLVTTWNDRMADRATEALLEELPERLQACWERGEALDGGELLEGPEQRRAAIAAYWATRTDTVYGDRVRDVVDAFVRAVVMTGGDPYTPGELEAVNAGRVGQRPFPGPAAAP